MSTDKNSAYGFGVATQNFSGQVLDCVFFNLGLGDPTAKPKNSETDSLIGKDPIRAVERVPVEVKINLQDKPKMPQMCICAFIYSHIG